jgi:hypothetical protein
MEQNQSNAVPHFNHQMNPAPPMHGNGMYGTPARPALYDTMQQPVQEEPAPFHGFGTSIAGEPPLTSLLGDPNAFLADESLLELMKWGASSFGPDVFGSGMWPFPGDTPSSHGGQRGF